MDLMTHIMLQRELDEATSHLEGLAASRMQDEAQQKLNQGGSKPVKQPNMRVNSKFSKPEWAGKYTPGSLDYSAAYHAQGQVCRLQVLSFAKELRLC
jgi:hypothetical protein